MKIPVTISNPAPSIYMIGTLPIVERGHQSAELCVILDGLASAFYKRKSLPAQETYPHAPIVEAVLDIRVRLSTPITNEPLEDIKMLERDSYPNFRQPFHLEFRVDRPDPSQMPTHQVSSTANGGALVSADGLQIFQARPDGFSHNRLAPYQDWQTFSTEARRLWSIYKGNIRPEFVELVGLNYINRVWIPGGVEISDYLRTYIHVPAELPQMLEVHNLQLQMGVPDSNAKISIVISFGNPESDNRIPVTLNVQAFEFLNRPVAELSEDELWATFDHLRETKNQTFESCISDKVRAEFR